MKILLTLDYELFFGSNTGTLQKSIIEPTNKLLKVLNQYNVKATFFVDSGYVLKLKEYRKEFKILENDYKKIISQIRYLHQNGHEIALHIHPHWEDSFFDGNKWVLNVKRYKLHDFNKDNIKRIVFEYKNVLEEIIDDKIITFRAGGWCIQPFDKIKDALKESGIKIDSTLYKNGLSESETHYFDFRNMPDKDFYKFENDPLVEKQNGSFTEIPISSIEISPFFFWKFAFFKIFGKEKFKSFGNGKAIERSKLNKLKLMLTFSNSVVSIDGYKSTLLEKAYKNYKKTRLNNFVIIAHPKALSEFSLVKLESFIKKYQKEIEFVTYKSYL